ncbi:Polyketide synthase [Penicillium angulare]|uniref:Polyketide synthase n=1 Tax=Penicillium angulare TaxID=116970 RepID=A0A9W9G778_9EURO|nr:Polyketide synthase [Penicillium angulare]
MVASVGYVAKTKGTKERLSRQGYQLVNEEEVLKLVEDSIASPHRPPEESQVLIGIPRDFSMVRRDDSPLLFDVRFAGLY